MAALHVALLISLLGFLGLFLVPPLGQFATAFIQAHPGPVLVGMILYVVGWVTLASYLTPPPVQQPSIMWLVVWWLLVGTAFGGAQLLNLVSGSRTHSRMRASTAEAASWRPAEPSLP